MRLWLVLAGLDGALAVVLGAYGAHAMADAPAYPRDLMDKATRYQMYHALALGLTALVAERRGGILPQVAGTLFVLGTLLFCGALYAIALGGVTVAALAPFGGGRLHPRLAVPRRLWLAGTGPKVVRLGPKPQV